MKLVLLYGPPAVGKLTVARELQKLTGFKKFDNHSILDIVSEIFGWESPVRSRLEHEIRKRIVEEAAASGISLIATGAIVHHNEFLYKGMIDAYEKLGGQGCPVQLTADRTVLLERTEHKSRKNKINSPEKLEEFLNRYPESVDKFGEGKQLKIDTSNISPKEAAKQITKYYKL